MSTSVSPFKVVSDYRPAGDQPQAIAALVEGLQSGLSHQTLLGVTGSGKTEVYLEAVAEALRNNFFARVKINRLSVTILTRWCDRLLTRRVLEIKFW